MTPTHAISADEARRLLQKDREEAVMRRVMQEVAARKYVEDMLSAPRQEPPWAHWLPPLEAP